MVDEDEEEERPTACGICGHSTGDPDDLNLWQRCSGCQGERNAYEDVWDKLTRDELSFEQLKDYIQSQFKRLR